MPCPAACRLPGPSGTGAVDPKNILEKGFSITRINGKAVRETDRVKKGDVLETELFKGVIRSEIKDIETNI